jgi:prepilin peptidase CpaA
MGHPTLSVTLELIAVVLFALAALQDMAFRLVSNRVPLGIAVLGGILRATEGDLAAGLLAAVVVFAVAAFCWRRGWLGGADVKLFGAGALLVPPSAAFGFVLSACLAGGVLAILYWLLGRLAGPPATARPSGFLQRLARVERRRLRRGGPLPYAVAVTAGVCFILIGT